MADPATHAPDNDTRSAPSRVHFLRDLIVGAGRAYARAEVMVHARAIAYAALFALVPLFVLGLSYVGVLLRSDLFTWYFEQSLPDPVSNAFAQLGEQALSTSSVPRSGTAVKLIAAGFAAWGASTLLMQLRTSLNRMFNLARKSGPEHRGALKYVIRRALSLLLAIALGSAFVAINIGTFIVSTIGASFLAAGLRGGWLGSVATTLIVNVLLFALVYRALPQGTVRWRDLLPGAIVTALLFWLGNVGVGIYFQFAQGMLRYGIASIALVILFWIFAMALIVLFGAKLTAVYARMVGHPVLPDEGMYLLESDRFFQT